MWFDDTKSSDQLVQLLSTDHVHMSAMEPHQTWRYQKVLKLMEVNSERRNTIKGEFQILYFGFVLWKVDQQDHKTLQPLIFEKH